MAETSPYAINTQQSETVSETVEVLAAVTEKKITKPSKTCSVDALLHKYEHKLVASYLSKENHISPNQNTLFYLERIGIKYRCFSSSLLPICVPILIGLFALIFHSILGLSSQFYLCSGSGVRHNFFKPCFINDMDFDANYHGTSFKADKSQIHRNQFKRNTLKAMDMNATLVLNTTSEAYHKFKSAQPSYMTKVMLLYDIAFEAEQSWVYYNDNGTYYKKNEIVGPRLETIMWVWVAGLGLELSVDVSHDSVDSLWFEYSQWLKTFIELRAKVTDVVNDDEMYGFAFSRTHWLKFHDFNNSRSTLLSIIKVLKNTFDIWGIIVLYLHVHYLFIKMGRNKTYSPVLYSVAVAMRGGIGYDEEAATENRKRTEELLKKSFFRFHLPLLGLLGFFRYGVFLHVLILQAYTWLYTIGLFCAFFMTCEVFTYIVLLWVHLDTHVENVRRTAELLMLEQEEISDSEVAKHYADVIASLQVFCSEHSPLMAGFLWVGGSPMVTSALSISKAILGGNIDGLNMEDLVVFFLTSFMVMKLLHKMASIKVEHERLESLISYKELERPWSGIDALSSSRGCVRIYNIPIDYSKMLIVPEAVCALFLAALVPIVLQELNIDEGGAL